MTIVLVPLYFLLFFLCNVINSLLLLSFYYVVYDFHLIFAPFQAPKGVHVVCKSFPRIKIVTSEIEIGLNEDFRVIPGMGEFGDRYFGTDDDDEQVVVSSQ